MKAINDQTPMLELQHNVKLILDMVEIDIQKFNNQNLRHESEGERMTLERKGEGATLEKDCVIETSRQH